MYRNFRYRLWTTPNQERELSIMLETHRRLYNECLSLKQMAWQTAGVNITAYDLHKWFGKQRHTNPFWMRLNVTSARATIGRLERAFFDFYRRCQLGDKPGYPRFRQADRYDSFAFHPDSKGMANGAKLVGDRLRIQHVGTIRVKLHRPLEGTIKTTTIKREAGKWYVIFACELPDVPVTPSDKPAVGVDVGLEHFLTTSDGEHVANPRLLKIELPELRRRGRSVSRKKKGGTRRRKAVRRLQKIHANVRNLRKEHHHQTSLSLVRRYGLIAVESLNVQGMLRSRWFSRAIGDAGWAGFIGVLKHKAEKAGVRVVAVDCRGTSQECSRCGQIVRKELKVRQHDCPHCGLSIHRDHNAARNILARARQGRTGPAGANAPLGVCPEKLSPSGMV